MRDLHSNIKTVQHLPAAVYAATQTPTNGIDVSGFSALELLIAVGEAAGIATGSWTFKLQESDSQSSGFTDVTDANIVLTGSAKSLVGAPDASTGVFLTIDDAADDEQTYRVGYIGTKRFVRVVATAVGTPGNTPMSFTAILGLPHQSPTSD